MFSLGAFEKVRAVSRGDICRLHPRRFFLLALPAMPLARLESIHDEGESRISVEGQPDDLARTVAVVAVRRLSEGVGELPFLLFVAPLGSGVGDDVVRAATGADGRRARRPYPSLVRLLGRFLPGMKGIEK